MDILLKQRIVGAIVLISLAVIFIPMLLSGKTDLLTKQLNSNIPPKPSYEIRRPEIAVNEKPSEKPEQPSFARPESEKVKQQPILDAEKVSPKTINPSVSPPVDVSKVPPEPSSSKKPSELTSPKTETPAPDKLAPAKSTQTTKENAQLATSWVVQVGSFSKEKNAITLRDKIQKVGISSFISEAQSSTGRVYRVRVGPELKRSLADNLRKKIHKKFKLDGIVIRYP